MKTILILLLTIILFSCNNEERSSNYILYPDSTNYEYKPLKNGLLKVVRFFPETKDTSRISFIKTDSKTNDSIFISFYRNGTIMYKIKYDNNTKNCKYYYKNGNLRKEFTVINNHTQGEFKYYYKTGELKAIHDIVVYNDSTEHLNSVRLYKKSGTLYTDSTYFVELISKKDTISINDSLKIEFSIHKPDNSKWRAYFGTLNKHFKDVNYKEVKFVQNREFYFKPKHMGVNYVEIVFEIYHNKKYNEPSYFTKTFLKKEVYVTE